MEFPQTSKYPTADGGNDVRESFRYGIKLDGEWKYQRVPQGTSGCGPSWACKSSICNPVFLAAVTTENPLANRGR